MNWLVDWLRKVVQYWPRNWPDITGSSPTNGKPRPFAWLDDPEAVRSFLVDDDCPISLGQDRHHKNTAERQ